MQFYVAPEFILYVAPEFILYVAPEFIRGIRLTHRAFRTLVQFLKEGWQRIKEIWTKVLVFKELPANPRINSGAT